MDEANYINNAILNDLKILFNFEMDSRDRAAILLAGLPKLNSTLGLGIHEPLKQRMITRYCDQSMLLGDSNKASLSTTVIVMQAVNDCELG